MEVCLVYMPYGTPVVTSLGLGLLKAILNGKGIRTRVIYANLLFLEHFGLDVSKTILDLHSRQLGSWLFSPLISPLDNPDPEPYIQFVIEKDLIKFASDDPVYVKNLLIDLRKKARDFIESLVTDIIENGTRIVGVSVNFLQLIPSLALLSRIRERSSDVITVMGGPACETIMGITLHQNFPHIDFVVSGEADQLIHPLVCSLLKKGRDVDQIELPIGVFAPVHRRTGYPEEETLRSSPFPIETLPVPDYDEYFETLRRLPVLREKLDPSISVESSRGCWWAQKKPCRFCGLNSTRGRYRTKSPEKTLLELDALAGRYGTNRFNMTDTMMNMAYIKMLMPELIRRGSPYRLFYEVTSRLESEDVKTLREAGVVWLQPGVESLSSDILAAFNKGTETWQNIQILKWCQQYGVKASWNILYDFPGENDGWYKEMSELMPLLFHLQPPHSFRSVSIARYSEYFARRKEYGLKLQPQFAEIYPHILPLPDETLWNLSSFFEHEREEEADLFSSLLHPWRDRAKKEAVRWHRIAQSDPPPTLLMIVAGDALHIKDTRHVARSTARILTGPEKDIYLDCDHAPLEDDLLMAYAAKGLGICEIKTIIETLLQSKLVVDVDRRLVSLALQDPCRELPSESGIPRGQR